MDNKETINLGRWITNKRHLYKKGMLSSYEIQSLNDVGFKWEGRKWLPFKEARSFVHSLKLKSGREWNKFCKTTKKPNNIPANPHIAYKHEWISRGDWLGTHRIADQYKTYLSYNEAKKIVSSLKFKSINEYWNWWKKTRPENIPYTAERRYSNSGWTTWGDYLGTHTIAPQLKQFRSFKEAKSFIHTLKLKSQREWNKYYKSGNKPFDIPSGPVRVYKDEWINWKDWLGNGNGKNRRPIIN